MFAFRKGFSHFVTPHAQPENLNSFLLFILGCLLLPPPLLLLLLPILLPPFLSFPFSTTEHDAGRRTRPQET